MRYQLLAPMFQDAYSFELKLVHLICKYLNVCNLARCSFSEEKTYKPFENTSVRNISSTPPKGMETLKKIIFEI